ncbi:MAG TPA: transposase [Beijerinckiaceae bacterium]|nr:transposase [Beijerinckiaceae bacterium]
MARLSRIVIPQVPHHVTQRGNRRAPIFFEPGDQALYLDLMAERCRKAGVACWAWCLMPNHVHLILTPPDADSLSRAVGEAHRRYTGFVNARARQTGHLFQSRFASVAMDDAHLLAAVRYVSLNPVRAGLVRQAQDWEWSSVRAHLAGRDDRLVRVRPVLERVGAFTELLEEDAPGFAALRKAETTGRPLGSETFLARAERLLGRPLAPGKRGPKPKG